MKEQEKIKSYPKERAKALFKELRRRGFRVDLGQSTGNIYSPAGQKITWMTKDFQDNWNIEKL